MIIRKILICLALLFSACAGPGQFTSKKSWAESTLKKTHTSRKNRTNDGGQYEYEIYEL